MHIPTTRETWKLAVIATALTAVVYAAYVGMVRGMGAAVAEPDTHERRTAIRHLAQSRTGMMAMHPDGRPARFFAESVPNLGPADCTRDVTTFSSGTRRPLMRYEAAFTCFETLTDREGNPITGMMILRATTDRNRDRGRWRDVGRRLQVHEPHERDYHPILRARLGLPEPE